jgi:rod shape-determining protein MreD
MSYLVVAASAVVAAVFELSLVPYLEVAGAHPHLVLVASVILTVAFGFERGLAVAVAGGLALDILAARPLGSSVFVLLTVVGVVGPLARALDAVRVVAPILLTLLTSPLFSLGLMVVLSISQGRAWVDDPIGLVVPGAIYDGVLAALIGPLIVSVRARAKGTERFEW